MRYAAVLALIGLVGCGAAEEAAKPPPTVGGNWNYTAASGGTSEGGTMTVNQSGNSLTGSFTMGGDSGTLTGGHQHPDVSLSLTIPGYAPFLVTAKLDGNSIKGTMNGSGAVNATFIATKQ